MLNKSCVKSLDTDQLACFSSETKRIYVSQVKPGNSKLEFEELKFDELVSLSDFEIVCSTKDTFLLKTSTGAFVGLSNLYLFNRQSLIKKYENLNSFNLVVKDAAQLLIYAKYLGASVILKNYYKNNKFDLNLTYIFLFRN